MNLLSLTMFFPLLGYIMLALSQGKCSKNISAIIGIGSISISACITMYIVFDFFYYVYNYNALVFVQKLWKWFSISDLHVFMSFRLDGLSLTMLSMIVGIGLIIHIYAAWYMNEYTGYSRFFAYTNLFMFNMILLVLSDNLLLMYFGWEGVGFCSYLLIGFYYFNEKNGIAAFKAFIMTRLGDICLMCALFIIYHQYHTLSFSELLILQQQCVLNDISNSIKWVPYMLLIGAIVKSAQFPFHTWLTSAMVGPTPASALIHAATMVTSGVYLIVRMGDFFLMIPNVLYLVGVFGAITLILSSCSALLQSDIKKILAYSTVSQVGYMFLALGGGHWIAAIFHLVIHAFFKALLFLAAGSLIYVCSGEQNIFKMRVFYKSVPLIYICFLIGGASLSAFPIITAGFYSKELILSSALVNHDYFFWISGLVGAFLTSVYIFRMIFVIFHGKKKIESYLYNNVFCQNFPLIVLLVLSTCIGALIESPLSNILLNTTNICNDKGIYFEIISGILVFFGIWVASYFWLNTSYYVEITNRGNLLTEIIMRYIIVLCYYGWGVDKIYKIIFVRPYLFIVNKLFHYDSVDIISRIIISLFCWVKNSFKYSVNGELNWYIASINVGAVIVLVIVLSRMYICNFY